MDTQGKGRRRGRGSYVHPQAEWNHNKHSGANSWSINLYWGAPVCQGNKVVSEKISMKRPKPKRGWSKCQLWGCQMLGVTPFLKGGERCGVNAQTPGVRRESQVEGTGRPLISYCLPRSHWLSWLTLLNYPSLIFISRQVSLHQQYLGIVAGFRLAQGGNTCCAWSCGLVWTGQLWLG